MGKIENDQAMCILCFACQADAVASSPRSDTCVVYTPRHLAVADIIQILRVGSGLIDVVDISVSWVVVLIPMLSERSVQS